VILTGPNQGGKTTYMQAIGLAQVMAQSGLFVPGRRARISPVDGIHTHFPVEERVGLGLGRFGDEARRIRTLF
jgi:DNA mismatch repair ATPase MutS